MNFSLNYLTSLKPDQRAAYVREHVDEIEKLTDKQKDRVGTLLCHASPEEVRSEHPILGDLRANKAQERFDDLAPTKGIERAQELAIGKGNGKN